MLIVLVCSTGGYNHTITIYKTNTNTTTTTTITKEKCY